MVRCSAAATFQVAGSTRLDKPSFEPRSLPRRLQHRIDLGRTIRLAGRRRSRLPRSDRIGRPIPTADAGDHRPAVSAKIPPLVHRRGRDHRETHRPKWIDDRRAAFHRHRPLSAPVSIPSGEIYETLDAQPATVPAPMLAACVKALADAVIVRRGGSVTSNSPTVPPVRPTDATDVEARAIAYLSRDAAGESLAVAVTRKLTPRRPRWSTVSASIADRALAILAAEYNPRCDPPWSEKELRHKVNQAATKPHDRPFGWLRDSEAPAEPVAGEST